MTLRNCVTGSRGSGTNTFLSKRREEVIQRRDFISQEDGYLNCFSLISVHNVRERREAVRVEEEGK